MKKITRLAENLEKNMLDDLRILYQDVLLDHGKNPRNHRVIDNASYLSRGNNPLCGDVLVVFLIVDDGIIMDISFKGDGCAISVASASIMTQILKGKTIEEVKSLFNLFHKMCTEDDVIVEQNDDTDRLQLLAGVRTFPMRVKCATLAWHTMYAALDNKSEVTTE